MKTLLLAALFASSFAAGAAAQEFRMVDPGSGDFTGAGGDYAERFTLLPLGGENHLDVWVFDRATGDIWTCRNQGPNQPPNCSTVARPAENSAE